MGRDYLARCRSIRVRDGKSCEMTRQRTSESFRIRLRFGVVPERDLLHHCRTAQASVKWTLIIAFGNTVRSQLEVNERICRKRPGRILCRHRKKAAEAICQEVTREVDQLLRVIFNAGRKTGRVDLEAIETSVRSAMHQAGAATLTELL